MLAPNPHNAKPKRLPNTLFDRDDTADSIGRIDPDPAVPANYHGGASEPDAVSLEAWERGRAARARLANPLNQNIPDRWPDPEYEVETTIRDHPKARRRRVRVSNKFEWSSPAPTDPEFVSRCQSAEAVGGRLRPVVIFNALTYYRCTKCLRWLHEEEFQPAQKGNCGRLSWCRLCFRTYLKAKRKAEGRKTPEAEKLDRPQRYAEASQPMNAFSVEVSR